MPQLIGTSPDDKKDGKGEKLRSRENESAVDRPNEVLRVIKGTEVGNEVTLTIFRGGETLVIPVKLGNKAGTLDEHEG